MKVTTLLGFGFVLSATAYIATPGGRVPKKLKQSSSSGVVETTTRDAPSSVTIEQDDPSEMQDRVKNRLNIQKSKTQITSTQTTSIQQAPNPSPNPQTQKINNGKIQTDSAVSQNQSPKKAVEGQSTDHDSPILFSVDRDGIKAAIDEMGPKLNECYSSWIVSPDSKSMRESGELDGKMIVEFTIGEDHDQSKTTHDNTTHDTSKHGITKNKQSKVSANILVNDIKHQALTGCVYNLVENLHFEYVQKKTTVRYPFTFQSK